MVGRVVPPEYLRAGGDYLAALQHLGMRPKFLGWGWETASNHWLLILVTSVIDAGGPLALNQLLLRAYNAEATPKAISPFIVRVFSPEVARTNLNLVAMKNPRISRVTDQFGRPKDIPLGDDGKPAKILNVKANFFGIEIENQNVYQVALRSPIKFHERRQEWQRFRRNVEKLAA